MQESRLFKIVYYLLDKGQATAPELAEKLEVSVRTVYRDIDALSEAGIPVFAEAGRNGGIHLMKGFVLDKSLLSREEKQEILAAVQSINVTENIDSSETLQKLSAMFYDTPENWFEVDFSRWGNKRADNEKFELLKLAVIHRKHIKINYAGAGGEVSERTVQPLKLAYKAKAWYLKAFCIQKQDYRIFKLNRILKLEVLSEEFPYRSFPKEDEDSEGEYQQVKLWFPKEMAYRVYDEFDETQVERMENGDFIVSAGIPEGTWLISFLLSFGTQAEIISPAWLKEVLAEQALLIYEKYKT